MEYTNRVDTENLWVMSPGPARLMIGFLCYESARVRKYAISSLTNPSAKGYCRVKYVHLALGREDAEFAKSFITSEFLFPHTRGYCDRCVPFMEFDVQNENVLPQIDRNLLNKWDRKASRVFLHGLEEITPNFGDSWSSDGSFLGEHKVAAFRRGYPSQSADH